MTDPNSDRLARTIGAILTRMVLSAADNGEERTDADDRVRESIDRRSGRTLS